MLRVLLCLSANYTINADSTVLVDNSGCAVRLLLCLLVSAESPVANAMNVSPQNNDPTGMRSVAIGQAKVVSGAKLEVVRGV